MPMMMTQRPTTISTIDFMAAEDSRMRTIFIRDFHPHATNHTAFMQFHTQNDASVAEESLTSVIHESCWDRRDSDSTRKLDLPWCRLENECWCRGAGQYWVDGWVTVIHGTTRSSQERARSSSQTTGSVKKESDSRNREEQARSRWSDYEITVVQQLDPVKKESDREIAKNKLDLVEQAYEISLCKAFDEFVEALGWEHIRCSLSVQYGPGVPSTPSPYGSVRPMAQPHGLPCVAVREKQNVRSECSEAVREKQNVRRECSDVHSHPLQRSGPGITPRPMP
ncbi:hypothetical protein Scep_025535 [Stephania cephalantha]|uniref:Uncharacterized protein n=1 Tax=Stephania cephalantha TaxID=152367 RepID=A0AAP0HRN4_9MAGN